MAADEGSYAGVIALIVVVALVATYVTFRLTSERETQWTGRTFSAPAVSAAPAPEAPQAPSSPPPTAGKVFGLSGGARPATATSSSGPAAGPAAAGAAAASPKPSGRFFSDAVTGKMNDIWARYTASSPAVQRLKSQLYADPYCKSIIDKYWQDNDLGAYLKAGIGSSAFRKAVIGSFVTADGARMLTDFMRAAPPATLAKVGEEIQKDRVAGQFAQEVAGATGLPVAALTSGQAPSQDQMLKSLMSNPNFQVPSQDRKGP